jgi:hypothetical protein
MRLRSSRLALAVGSCLIHGCHAPSLPPSEIVADSVSGFSGKQGANGWYYGYWDRSADTDQRYSQTTDFQLIKDYGSDPINGLSRRTDFATGKLWTLQDGVVYTAVWAEGGSANGTTKLAQQAKVEHWAVRRWGSTVNGPVTISGHAAKILNWGDAESGQARIVVDGQLAFSSATHIPGTDSADIVMRGTNYIVQVPVHIGSPVDFLITAGPAETGGAFGPVKFTATIRAVP